jgi:N-methylhydantoinase A
VDIGGALRVGPESAGAAPGPACYSEGEDPTVTDANLLLGRFGRNSLLGGELTLQPERSLQVFEKLATMISHSTAQKVTPITAALGVIAVANTNMEQALRVVSIERGYDPRTFTLVSFGGAGGLHVAELAYALRIPKILIPAAPGALSALGVLMADVVKDYSRTVMLAMDEINIPTIDEIFNELKKKASQDLTQEGFHTKQMHLVRHAAMRYRGQSFELDLPWSRQIEAAFHQLHEKRYGYSDRTRATELVSLRLRAIGETVKPPIIKHRLSRHKPQPAFFSKVYFRAKAEKIPVYERDNLPIGAKLRGPLIVTEYSATTLLPAGFRLTVDHFANLVIELRK